MGRLFKTYKDAYSGLNATVWLLCLVVLINRAGTMVMPFMTLYLTKVLNYGAAEAGLFLGGFGVGAILGSYSGGWLVSRLNSTLVQAFALLVQGSGFLCCLI